jgi:hypothetical protein
VHVGQHGDARAVRTLDGDLFAAKALACRESARHPAVLTRNCRVVRGKKRDRTAEPFSHVVQARLAAPQPRGTFIEIRNPSFGVAGIGADGQHVDDVSELPLDAAQRFMGPIAFRNVIEDVDEVRLSPKSDPFGRNQHLASVSALMWNHERTVAERAIPRRFVDVVFALLRRDQSQLECRASDGLLARASENRSKRVVHLHVLPITRSGNRHASRVGVKCCSKELLAIARLLLVGFHLLDQQHDKAADHT